MTLGLATSEPDRIVLAIESEGLPACCSQPPYLCLVSKVVELQLGPPVALLAAGGLDHWCFVAGEYVQQPSVEDAAKEVKRLLDECMTQTNQAFGLICGFSHNTAKCFRVNREQNRQEATCEEECFHRVQSIGEPSYANAATLYAENEISKGKDRLTAVVTAIDARFGNPGLRPPIHVRCLRPQAL